MNLEMLRDAAESLGELRDEVVFLGAATLPLWITDSAADALRPTKDVDVVVEVTSRRQFNDFENRLRHIGFRDEQSQIGRFVFGSDGVMLDVIPSDASVLGFENTWQRESIKVSSDIGIGRSLTIRVIPAYALLATKLEAHQGRGQGDLFGSKDFEDIVRLVDGREELVTEVAGSMPNMRTYLSEQFSTLLGNPRLPEACAAHLDPGEAGELRADRVTIPRMREISSLLEVGSHES